MSRWSLVVVDFTEVYHVRLDLLLHEEGSWPWAKEHIVGLIGTDSRLYRALHKATTP